MVTSAHSSRQFLAPGDKLGKHEVICQIAVGGTAELYLARTVEGEGLERLVCVKRVVPPLGASPSFVSTFLHEARRAATLRHPNIAQVFDTGQESGGCFVSTEYVHGEDLGRLIAASRENGVPLSLERALSLVSGVCAGLHHAHEQAGPDGKPLGMVHRAVAPSNVLVGYDGVVKVVDFGIARAGGAVSQETRGTKGKSSYLSPEQCRGQGALDRRSDVFSTGTLLYELTTGHLPFVGETEQGVRQQIASRDAERPSKLVQDYPPALEAIVMHALAREPGRRFATALELQQQIEGFAQGQGLRISPVVVARLMATLFPAGIEGWEHARAQGAFFVEQHVMRTLTERGKSGQPPPPITGAGGAGARASSATLEHDPEATLLGGQPRPPAASPGMDGPPGRRPSQPPVGAEPPGRRPSQPPVGAEPPGRRPSQPPVGAEPPPVRNTQLGGPPPPSPVGTGRPASQPTMGSEQRTRPSQPPVGVEQPPVRNTQLGVQPPPLPVGTGRPASQPTMGSEQGTRPPSPAMRAARPASQPAMESEPMGTRPSQPMVGSEQGTRPPSPAMRAARPAPSPAIESEPPVAPPSRGSGQLGAAMSSAPPAPGLQGPMPVTAMAPVPLVTPPSVPLIPSGGTLVSSATQAGNLPPAVKPVVGPYGPTGGLDGLAGQSGHLGYAGPSGHGAGGFAGPSGSEGLGAGNAVPTYDSTVSRAGDVTDRVRIAAARPTMKIDIGRRSRLPTVLLGIFSAVGALVIVWFVAVREDGPAPAASGPTTGAPAKATPAKAATPGKSSSTPAEAAMSPGKAAEPSREAATPPAEPAARSADEAPAKAAEAPAAGSADEAPAKAAEPPAKVAEPATPVEPAPATPAEPVKPEAAKKKPASVGVQEPHPKPVKKSRSKRASKAEPKEQTWNDDSPFMPVATPKH